MRPSCLVRKGVKLSWRFGSRYRKSETSRGSLPKTSGGWLGVGEGVADGSGLPTVSDSDGMEPDVVAIGGLGSWLPDARPEGASRRLSCQVTPLARAAPARIPAVTRATVRRRSR